MVTLRINGKSHQIDVPSDMPVLWVLRDVLGMTGTKFGCGMALCGACTVQLDGQAIRPRIERAPCQDSSPSHLAMLVSATILGIAVAVLFSFGPGEPADANVIDAASFRCITSMTPVRQFYVDNLGGDVAATVAAANSATGSVYPPGSVIQLIPGEAMVKREKGFNPATRDWEFFELDVSKNGTEIRKRGFADVVNRFGGNCFACHIAARPEWDLVCESDHGCRPIPVTRAMIAALQRTDPRCNNPAPSPEDAEALRQLQQLPKAGK